MIFNAGIETGAGNSFLGGLAAGMLISGDMYQGWHSVIGRKRSLNFLRLISRLVCDRLGVFHHRTRRSTCRDLYTNWRVEWGSTFQKTWCIAQTSWKYSKLGLHTYWMCRNNDNIIHRRHCCPDWNLARLAAKSSSCFASNSSSVNPDCSNFETFFSRSWDIKDEVWYLTKRIDNTFCCCLWSLRTLSTSGANVVKPRRYKTYEGVSNNNVSAYALLAQWLCVQERWFSYSPVRIFHSPLRILNGWILQWIRSVFKAIALKVESCSPTQHSITKSRVSLAHTTSLGNSSTGGEENERWGIERRWDFTDQRSSWQR